MMLGFHLTTWIDAVIAFTLLEMLLLCVYRRLTGRGLPAEEFLVNMVSGLCLMLALRALAGGASTAWVMLALLAAGLTHVSDLWRRWQRRASHPFPGAANSSAPAPAPAPSDIAAACSPHIRVSQVHP